MPSDELCESIRSCGRCRLAQTRIHALCGEGDPSARLMLVAQAPGQVEDREGAMFLGPSGRVLDELLDQAGVAREAVYMTNLVKCFLPGYRKPKPDEIQACRPYLDAEIERVAPEVIVPLGFFAIRDIFERHGLPMPEKSAFFTVLGQLHLVAERKIYPLRHPAALLHNRALEPEMAASYAKLGVLLSPCKWHPVCPIRYYCEAGKLDCAWVERYCKGDWASCVRYQLEERGQPHPDWMLPDGSDRGSDTFT
ncbi:MAG: uracil-DNA glycosylase [Deltaproteobacteria bacterium]|nr:uracil-DNA glycosylase [Deltaproteobacteria bacterium]